MGKYKYLFYDFDGTIANTYDGVAEAMEMVFNAYNLNVDKALYPKYIGPPINDTFASYLGTKEKGYEAAYLFRKYYNENGCIDKTVAYDGIKETFKSLYEKGYKVCIASCKKHEEAIMLLKRFGLFDYVEFVSGLCYNVRETKRAVLEYAVNELKADIKDCVMIGDTRFDVEGAEEIGMDCILCLWGFGDYDAIKNKNVIFRAKDPYEVEKYIEE